MKNLVLILFFYFTSATCFAQDKYFEGKIIYKTTFEIKDSTKRAIYFSKINPTSSIEYFKEGNSFITYDKGDTKTYLYLQSENKAFMNHWSKDTLYFFDCSLKGREIITYSLKTDTTKILGLQCDKLEVVFKNGTSTYYFSKNELNINPAWYQKLTYVNWDFISQIIKSIPLKTVIERTDYRITNVAISYTKEKVDKQIFKISSTYTILEDK